MKDIVFSYDSLLQILKDCYRKYKSSVYFQNVYCFRKKQIALFESDKDNFEKAFSNLAHAIIDKDDSFFEKIAKSIGFVIVPKKTTKKDKETSTISNRVLPETVTISDINFYIDGDIELFILDVFITLEFGLRLDNFVNLKDMCYANVFNKHTFFDDSVNYKSLYIFNYYFYQYRKWKNDAIRKAEDKYKAGDDTSIISIDLTNYFYRIRANINRILKDNSIDFHEFINLSYLLGKMQLFFDRYFAKVNEYRKDLDFVFLPIGLNLSAILSNLYLRRFDLEMKDNCIHYGRYVDDIVFVIKGVKYDSFEKYALDNPSLFKPSGNNSFVLKMFPELVIKQEKCRILNNHSNGSSDIFKKMKSEEYSVSEYNLFPSFNADIESLINDAYEKQEYIKFRDIESLSVDPSKIGKLVSGLITARKGTAHPKEDETKEMAENLYYTLSSTDCINLCLKWEKLILLFAWLQNKGCLKKFSDILKHIGSNVLFVPDSSLKEAYPNKKIQKKILTKIKQTLKDIYENAITSFKALKPINPKSNILISLYRNANLVDFASIKYPLVNFSSGLKNSDGFVDLPLSSYIELMSKDLDLFKVSYSPCNINLNDYMFAKQISGIALQKECSIEKLYDDYYSLIGNIFGMSKENIVFSEKSTLIDYSLTSVNMNSLPNKVFNSFDKHDIKIAVAGIDLDKMSITNKGHDRLYRQPLKQKNKKSVVNLLNESYSRDFTTNSFRVNDLIKRFFEDSRTDIVDEPEKNKKKPVNYIVFPEVFLPLEWMHLFDKFAKETQSVITSGLRYVIYNKNVFNLVVCEVPFLDSLYHKQSIVIIREKNDMPLYEKNIIKESNLNTIDKEKRGYFLVEKDDIGFAPLICYEATDLCARSLFKNNIDYLFTVAYNKDTNYFNSIGMSTARDLFCFYIECNSSKYGSASYAPLRSAFLPISTDKGNSRDHMQIVATDLESIREYKSDYLIQYSVKGRFDFYDYKKGAKPNKKYSKFKKPSANTK